MMGARRKAYTVTTNLQAIVVAEKPSKEAAAMLANNSQLTIGVFTLHNETGLMHIQTGLIHFGRVHTESGLSETGFKPV